MFTILRYKQAFEHTKNVLEIEVPKTINGYYMWVDKYEESIIDSLITFENKGKEMSMLAKGLYFNNDLYVVNDDNEPYKVDGKIIKIEKI